MQVPPLIVTFAQQGKRIVNVLNLQVASDSLLRFQLQSRRRITCTSASVGFLSVMSHEKAKSLYSMIPFPHAVAGVFLIIIYSVKGLEGRYVRLRNVVLF